MEVAQRVEQTSLYDVSLSHFSSIARASTSLKLQIDPDRNMLKAKRLKSSKLSAVAKDARIIAGRIYWFPAKPFHNQSLLENYSIGDGCFNHPVVILSTDAGKAETIVFIVGLKFNLAI